MIGLKFYTTQLNIKTPFPGTQFWKDVEHLLIDNFRYKDCDGHHQVFNHPTISKEKMEAIQLDAQKRDYFELGPSLVRAPEIIFRGYNTFKSSKVPRIQKRVETSRKDQCHRTVS